MADRSAESRGLGWLRVIREVWEWGSWAISVLGTLFSAAEAVGLTDFLAGVGLFGFACYVAAIPVAAIMIFCFGGLEKLTGREINDTISITVLILGILAGGFFVRSGFAVEPDDLDSLGRGFSALVGAAFLLIPVYLLWRRFGSGPRGRGARGRRRAAPPS